MKRQDIKLLLKSSIAKKLWLLMLLAKFDVKYKIFHCFAILTLSSCKWVFLIIQNFFYFSYQVISTPTGYFSINLFLIILSFLKIFLWLWSTFLVVNFLTILSSMGGYFFILFKNIFSCYFQGVAWAERGWSSLEIGENEQILWLK